MKLTGEKMKIGYIRNSRITQENSVEVQNKLINDFCENNKITLDKIVVDEGISGSGEKTKLRDGYNSIIEMIHNQEIDTLVVISISRWGRNLGEIYKSVQLMETKGVNFLSIKENIDTSTPYGRFTINLLSSLYEMELELIKERVKDTLKVKKENGKVYSPTPFGFNRVEQDLIENPKEKRLLRKMLRLKENGNSYGDISNYLKKNRHKTKSGGKWTRENVYSVMKTFIKNENITPSFV
ncbi:MAG: recombinase family protein [Candidatus Marinimicrobia bacterium]|jgi:site-specific DNA recombinase|nr:recombinase family protein [Candidatus Neomarinimicrobiota bacterium]